MRDLFDGLQDLVNAGRAHDTRGVFVRAPGDLTERLVERGAAAYLTDDEVAGFTIVIEARSPRPQRVVRLLSDEGVRGVFPTQLERWMAMRAANRLPPADIRVEDPDG